MVELEAERRFDGRVAGRAAPPRCPPLSRDLVDGKLPVLGGHDVGVVLRIRIEHLHVEVADRLGRRDVVPVRGGVRRVGAALWFAADHIRARRIVRRDGVQATGAGFAVPPDMGVSDGRRTVDDLQHETFILQEQLVERAEIEQMRPAGERFRERLVDHNGRGGEQLTRRAPASPAQFDRHQLDRFGPVVAEPDLGVEGVARIVDRQRVARRMVRRFRRQVLHGATGQRAGVHPFPERRFRGQPPAGRALVPEIPGVAAHAQQARPGLAAAAPDLDQVLRVANGRKRHV